MSNRRLGAPMEAKRVPGGYQNGCPGTPGGTSGGHEGPGCLFGAYGAGTATTLGRPLNKAGNNAGNKAGDNARHNVVYKAGNQVGHNARNNIGNIARNNAGHNAGNNAGNNTGLMQEILLECCWKLCG